MGHYIANTRDELFNLFEVFKLEEVLASGEFGDLDKTDVTDMIQEVANLATGPIAESYAESDRNPPVYDPKTFSVSIPEAFKKSVKAMLDSGWNTLGISEELGGIEVPRTVVWACSEMILGANPALHMYCGGAAFAQILYNIGNDEQKEWAKKIVEDNNWGTTMVLTEPDAGSDVGAGRTKAVQQADGTWHIEGVKRFITSGDSDDMFDNIFHLVLARPEGAGPGTKGLSLFFVPKYFYNFETGEKGERNGVFVTNVEHKMGLKVSATCEVTFGGHGTPAVGYLIGDGSLNQGIRQMFEVIENARMMVGTKSIAQLSTGYLNALAYAKERVQGADMADMANKTAPRVAIIQHPDVRRSLQTQKSYAEGLRALYLLAATYQNDISAKIFSGADPELARKVNDFLLPLVKGVGSEQGYAKLTESLQTFGGSGFLQDYPLEQYIRDSKIDSLYEGTTAIQALDFIFRKIVRDQAAAFNHILDQVTAFANSDQGGDKLKENRGLLSQALTDYRASFDTLSGYLLGAQSDTQNIYRIGLVSVRFLLATGDLLLGWLLQLQAVAAIKALEAGATGVDKDFYEGKIATANFFARTFLPDLAQAKYVVEQVDPSIMQLPVSAF